MTARLAGHAIHYPDNFSFQSEYVIDVTEDPIRQILIGEEYTPVMSDQSNLLIETQYLKPGIKIPGMVDETVGTTWILDLLERREPIPPRPEDVSAYHGSAGYLQRFAAGEARLIEAHPVK